MLHTGDFLSAYNLTDTDRSAELQLLGLQFDDRQELVEGENHTESDGRIDAGETVKLYPVIRTVFGEASNIKLHLEVGEYEDASIVTITQNDVDFGYHLSSYGKAVSKNPLVFKTKGNTADGRHIKLKLSISSDNTEQVFEHDFIIIVDNVKKVGGLLSNDLTLMASKKYLVSTNLAIPEGITLTIEPGTTVLFDENMGISCSGHLVIKGTKEQPITLKCSNGSSYWAGISSKEDTLEYCIIRNMQLDGYGLYHTYFSNCDFQYCIGWCMLENSILLRCNLTNCFSNGNGMLQSSAGSRRNTNCINNQLFDMYPPIDWQGASKMNCFNNRYGYRKDGDRFYDDPNGIQTYRTIGIYSNEPITIHADNPAYIGTSDVKIARTLIYEIGAPFAINGNFYSYGSIDLSNIRTEPYHDAHGIVWKILVNGKDAQDEYEEMLPLGVGRHKFEVYYNRPMNKAVIPNISFGVREPYTQNIVKEDGIWNEEGTIYTSYMTISKHTQSDGINRIYVWGGEDDEYFECPFEKTRFNVNIQVASSMSTGFMAEGSAGCVKLSWNKSGADDIDDAMGYNIYRYTERIRYEEVLDMFGNRIWDDEADDWQKREIIERDTLRINPYVIDVEAENYVDRAVIPGETYYYYYKLQGTNLKEYGISNTVSAVPKEKPVSGIIDRLTQQGIKAIYAPNGKKLDKPQKGLNIMLMNNGTTKKVVVK